MNRGRIPPVNSNGMQEAAEVPEDVGELHMPQEYYTVEKAAEILGMTPAEVNQLRERNQIRAFRDGANWKFPIEEVHRLAQQRREQAQPSQPEELELELGGPMDEEAQTVYAPTTPPPSEASDVELGSEQAGGEEEPELQLVDDSDVLQPPAEPAGQPEELQLHEEEEISLADSGVPLAAEKPPSNGSGGAALNLADEEAEDDDLVLGGSGSGSGSDVTIGQDSGISLVDPHDSGLSLEEPVELGGLDDDSLALGEDDMLTLAEEADTESPTQLQAEEEFRLSTDEELPVEEESESASQMIPLDMESGDEPTEAFPAPEVAAPGGMFEEAPAAAPGAAAPVEMAPAAGPVAQPTAELGAAAATLPEAPFGTLAMVGLIGSALILVLAGMMTVDLLRNMWSWNGTVELNSWLMDQILNLLG